jgi:uncharacterized protein YfaS (alpha-2-macroglobulin family)
MSSVGPGQLVTEVLDPDDNVLGRSERRLDLAQSKGSLEDSIRLEKPLPLEDLVWQRVRYRFAFDNAANAPLQGIASIAEILRRPIIRILGQQSYLAGGQAAVRVIVTDSDDLVIAGRASVQIEILMPGEKSRLLYRGELNRRGTSEAQFRLPANLTGSYKLRYVADTPIGSTEFTQDIRLADKVSILLTTEKPIYQPGQTIHVRALALDRANHEAASQRKLTFELEDSRGNKVFKRPTDTDQFGVASAEFALADEVNLGTYHWHALLGNPDAPDDTGELAINVERYVLPKFKVAMEFGDNHNQHKRGYQPGDHVTGKVRANYFFGKPVDNAEIRVRASAMDVAGFEAASAEGKTDEDGTYPFDLKLPKYFAGRPLNHGAARVLIEATVKDSAGHAETRGEPITVSDSLLLITAVPESGTLVPNLENEVFILASYPDGSPAKADLILRAVGNPDQRLSSDDGGVALARIKPQDGKESLEIDATDMEGSKASSHLELEARGGEDQILLRAQRAVYRTGERIQLKVFSTKASGAAYLDLAKDGQTILTRDVDLQNGQAELWLTATPEMAGTLDLSAYIFGRNAEAVGDHRLIFVQPADELKVETIADASSYKPGSDARIQFRVTDSRGEGVHAALGLQVVDEAVFALAEKQPGFAKVFFYLEQEVMKPRYEIHSIGLSEVVQPTERSQAEQHDRAARALFAATEVVNHDNFETKVGKDLAMTKFAEYWQRYQSHFQAQAHAVAKAMSNVYIKNPKEGSPIELFGKLQRSEQPQFRDSWGNQLHLEPTSWFDSNKYYVLRSAGPDRKLNTSDDLQAFLFFERKWIAGAHTPSASTMGINIEHDRGPFNGKAEIVGTVIDPTGAVIANARVEVREITINRVWKSTTDGQGQFRIAAAPAGHYRVQISAQGFQAVARKCSLHVRDRAVLSARLNVGSATQSVEVTSQSPVLQTAQDEVVVALPPAAMPAGVAGGVPGGIGAGEGGGMGGGVFRVGQNAGLNGRNFTQLVAINGGLAKEASPAAPARARSYFPEALYINPEIITDRSGRASILIPIADSITTWRMAMIASTEHGTLGTSTSSLKVFQDFFVDLDLPVTLTQGDRVSIPVAIYNYSGSQGEVKLQLQPENWFSLVDDTSEKSVEVDSSRVGGSQFTLEAKHIGKFKLTVSAGMNGATDRRDIVVREIEVIPNGREQNIVFNGRLENAMQHEINFPENSIPEASKILVRFYPGPISQVVEGMDSILRMPGGCFEQTSSSTYPNVLALDYMKRTKKLTPEVHAKAEGYIANGYQRLLTFEVPGGGFSWFGNVPANKILTAYGLMEFSDMSKIYDVDPKLISRTQQWLASQQQKDGSWKPDTQFINEGATNRYNADVLRITAYLAWALKNTGYEGPAVDRAKEFVKAHLSEKTDTYTLAVIANFAAGYATDRAFIRQAIQSLLDARTEKGEQIWWTAEETGVYGGGRSASIETTGLAVEALLESGEASDSARKALSYIASNKDAYGTWGTTQATIMALRALLMATEKGAADVRGTLTMLLNGKPAQSFELTPENNDLLHQFAFKTIEAGSNKVEIRFQGKGSLAYQVVGNYFLPWDQNEPLEPLSIDVTYDRTHLAQNDLAIATAKIKNHLDRTAKMVMVDLGIPPGFDLLSEDLEEYQEKSVTRNSGHLSKFSLTATQAILYFDSFAPGDSVALRFRLRAKYPIRARTFQSRVYEYYDPEISALARPVELEVHR